MNDEVKTTIHKSVNMPENDCYLHLDYILI